ncbi:MAG: MBL fold metallo-hydrolase [Faecalibacterium sp.]|nr:MBL fold metallo-hydrolase [Ruminococcus sp.]MCM1391411.1 MBL fold metallo-hydrolase [Ruminococcus sp.]MCM1485085.1 MBL fold metallo-hydrolase [Faecalibacterium sp.]
MSVSISKVVLGFMGTNCYLIKDEQTQSALVVDPAVFDNELITLLKNNNVHSLEYILLTHGHYDHILGAKQLKENYGGKIVISADDADCFTNGDKSLLSQVYAVGEPPKKADVTVHDGDEIMFGETKIKVMQTPGHTEGSVCYIMDDIIISGDTLFAGTVGRMDFPTGSPLQMKASIKKLGALNGHYKVFPGHNEATTLEYEKKNNVYFG